MARSDHSMMEGPAPHEYPASALRKTEWGEVAELEDGTWETTWNLTFTDEIASQSREVFSAETLGFCSYLTSVGRRGAVMRVRTREPAMSAVNYAPTYTSFRIINDELFTISTIQDLPRDWYPPFRDRKE